MFFATLPVLIYTSMLFDRLVRLQYEHHRKDWLADGEPGGFLWSPADWEHGCSWWARSRVMTRWLFKTPTWISESSSRQLLKRYRIFSAITDVMFLFLFAVLFLSR
jgi:hypothetical protein